MISSTLVELTKTGTGEKLCSWGEGIWGGRFSGEETDFRRHHVFNPRDPTKRYHKL